jgi:hypothetical protein
MDQKIKNIADEAKIKEDEKRLKSHRAGELDDLRQILALPQGRRVLWRILAKCDMSRLSATGDEKWTYVNEGKKSIGLFLIEEMTQVEPHAYPKLLMEMMTIKQGEKNV